MKKIIKASASGAKYAPIIGRDLDWFENDIERYVGKNAATLKKFLKDQDFVLDEMSGPARDSAWESWRLDTEAGNIMVVFYYDLIPTPNSGRLKDGKVTKAYVEDNQSADAIRDEEARLFSSRKISGSKKRIVASRRKRSIKASFGSQTLSHQHDYDDKYSAPAKRMAMVFPYFLEDINEAVQEEHASFYTKAWQMYGDNYTIEFEIVPECYGDLIEDDSVHIEFDANESPAFTARFDNGEVFATGESFTDILVDVIQAVKESLIEYYDNLDE